MDNFKRVVRLGTVQPYGRAWVSVYCKIEYDDGRLSISGVEGPRSSGNCTGSCGQIDMHLRDRQRDIKLAPGWTRPMIARFFDTWWRWHLNDMKAGSASQEAWLRDNPIPREEYAYPKSHYEVAGAKLSAAGLNPDADGYRYGHAWKREEVPADVLEWLRTLPETDKQPAWV